MRIFTFFAIAILFISCKSGSELKAWKGDYLYEEEPVEANADYSMAKVWYLTISEQEGMFIGNLEVNGQQTALKIKTQIEGDQNHIQVKFMQGLEGFGSEDFKSGDTLFTLQKNKAGDIFTIWQKLEPRLSEKYQNGQEFFIKNKRI